MVVVDEAILALSNYQLADPLEIFYADRSLDLMSVYGRSSIVLANPQALAQDAAASAVAAKNARQRAAGAMEARSRPAAAMPAAEPRMAELKMDGQAQRRSTPQPIRVRTDFNPLAVFAPAVRTGCQRHGPGDDQAAR